MAETVSPAPQPWLSQSGLIAASLVLCLLRLLVAAKSGLTDDEAYYRLWGLSPAWSYLDHPPMAGWLIWLGQALAGDNALGVRLSAVMAPLLGTLLTWRTATLLFGEPVAEWACWFGLAMPLMAAGGVIMTPDTPSVLCWGLTGWAVAELRASGRSNWWLPIGLFAGLGLLSKYTNLFAGAGILLWLLASGEFLRWVRTWQFWAGGVVAVLLTLPVLFWNETHHWASFSKQFGRVGAGEGLTLRFLAELLGGMFGLLSPAIAVLAMLGLWRATTLAFKDRKSSHLLLLCSVAPVGLYLLVHSLHDRVQANWPAPIYPALGLLAAIGLPTTRWLSEAAAVRVAWLGRLALPLGFAMSALIYLHVMAPLVNLAGERDPTSQMRGWVDFSRSLEAKRQSIGAQWVATSNYATTGQLAIRSPVPVLQLTERLRYVNLPAVQPSILGTPALYVELQRRQEPDLLRRRFRVVTDEGTLSRMSGGIEIAKYALFRVAEPVAPVLDPIE